MAGALSVKASLTAKADGADQRMLAGSGAEDMAGFQTIMVRKAIQPPIHSNRKRSAGASRRASTRRAITATRS
ncbi:MAG: hypothetical protein EOP63_09330 [Sphingomonadales bacterium]|nr:MAG: hypothetical protein EOP63_09330 [Sphingomonadales bacterium]